jgi:hypothetical protein
MRDLPDRAFEPGGAVWKLLKETGYVDPPKEVINNNQWWDHTMPELEAVQAVIRRGGK